MHKKEDGSKRQIFIDKKNMQQPIKISNLSVSPTGTVFFNKGALIHDVPNHSMPFQFAQEQLFQATPITTLIKSSSGTFNVSGTIKWKGEAKVPSETTKKQVRDATLTDRTGSIPLSIWGEHIVSVKEGEFYTFTECRLRHYYGKCLTTTQSTTVSAAEKQDISKAVQQDVQTWICCPDILNVSVNPFLTCNNKDCKKKIVTTPGSQIAKCHHCNRSMLVKNCYFDMTVSLNLEKDGKQYSVTAFSKAISTFLNEDIFTFKDNTDPLETNLLLLEGVDFQLSHNGKLVVKVEQHQYGSEENVIA